MNLLSIKHSYAGGDLISILPGLRHIYKETGKKWIIYQRIDFELFYYDGMIPATVNAEGKAVSMNKKHFEMLKPLLLSQDYIEDFKEWKGEKCDIDMDKSRDSRTIPIPYGLIHYWAFFIAPELSCDLSDKWLDIKKIWSNLDDKIIINRTERYTQPYISYYFLKDYDQERFLFVGTEKEHKIFNSQWNLNISHKKVKDFLELAEYLNSCKGFIGNQSIAWHIADSIKINRILEASSVFPNTFPTGAKGNAAIYVEAMELYVHKLFNK